MLQKKLDFLSNLLITSPLSPSIPSEIEKKPIYSHWFNNNVLSKRNINNLKNFIFPRVEELIHKEKYFLNERKYSLDKYNSENEDFSFHLIT